MRFLTDLRYSLKKLTLFFYYNTKVWLREGDIWLKAEVISTSDDESYVDVIIEQVFFLYRFYYYKEIVFFFLYIYKKKIFFLKTIVIKTKYILMTL